jgi:hypothetical protein
MNFVIISLPVALRKYASQASEAGGNGRRALK